MDNMVTLVGYENMFTSYWSKATDITTKRYSYLHSYTHKEILIMNYLDNLWD